MISDGEFQDIFDVAVKKFPDGPYTITVSAKALLHAFKAVEQLTTDKEEESRSFGV